MGVRGAGAILLAAGALATAAGGASAAGWLPAVDVSPRRPNVGREDLSLQDVAVDGAGTAIAVWTHDVGEWSSVVRAATRPRGGRWSAPVTLRAADEAAIELRVAAAPSGAAAAIWVASGAGGHAVHVATKPAGGPWEAPVAIARPDHGATATTVVVDAQGASRRRGSSARRRPAWASRAPRAAPPAGGGAPRSTSPTAWPGRRRSRSTRAAR